MNMSIEENGGGGRMGFKNEPSGRTRRFVLISRGQDDHELKKQEKSLLY